MAMDFSRGKNVSNLKKIQQKSIENSNSIVAIDVPLDQIDPNPDNENIFSMADIDYLAEGIKEEGFFGAIEVYRKPDGRYEISAGHRRYEAMKRLKRATIPCIVKDVPDDYARGKKLLSSNLRNRRLTTMDMARAIDYFDKLITEAGEKKNFRKQAAAFFNISEASVYRYQCLTHLIPELQEYANKPNFPYTGFQTAVNLSEDGQKELYYLIEKNCTENEDGIYGISMARLEQLIKIVREKEEYQARPHIKANKKLKEVSNKSSKTKEKDEGIEPLENFLKDYDEEDADITYLSDSSSRTFELRDVDIEIESLLNVIDNIDHIDKEKAKEYTTILKNVIKKIEEKSSK